MKMDLDKATAIILEVRSAGGSITADAARGKVIVENIQLPNELRDAIRDNKVGIIGRLEEENDPPGTARAYCQRCRAWTRMKWKPPEQRPHVWRGWYVCANCGADGMTLVYQFIKPAKGRP